MLVTDFSDQFLTAQISCDEGGVFTFKGKMLVAPVGIKVVFHTVQYERIKAQFEYKTIKQYNAVVMIFLVYDLK